MTISTTVIKNSYSGTGSQDVFPYSFKIAADADIQVIIRSATGTETVKTITTHYTVSGAGNATGGNVTFTAGNIPTNTETVVIRRTTTQTQSLDLVENDPFTAESMEGAFDKNLSLIQELKEEVGRSFKISPTNTISNSEITANASTRANKVFSFNSSGEIALDQELGVYKGNWAASTTYPVRSLVKDTSTNNIFLCNTAHTSAGSQPLTSNADSAKWELIVDAASATTASSTATTKAAEASTSAAEALSSKNSAATSEANALSSKNAAATSETNAASSASTASTKASEAATSATNAASSESAAAASASSAAASAGGGTVKVTSADTSPNDLNTKLLVSGNLSKTVGNAGGNETLTLSTIGGAEIYGFTINGTNNLIITTTNSGADSISNADYVGFDEKFFASVGFTWSLNSDGHLIATV